MKWGFGIASLHKIYSSSIEIFSVFSLFLIETFFRCYFVYLITVDLTVISNRSWLFQVDRFGSFPGMFRHGSVHSRLHRKRFVLEAICGPSLGRGTHGHEWIAMLQTLLLVIVSLQAGSISWNGNAVWVSAWTLTVLVEIFRSFSQSVQVNEICLVRILSSPFQFIVNNTTLPFHSTLHYLCRRYSAVD